MSQFAQSNVVVRADSPLGRQLQEKATELLEMLGEVSAVNGRTDERRDHSIAVNRLVFAYQVLVLAEQTARPGCQDCVYEIGEVALCNLIGGFLVQHFEPKDFMAAVSHLGSRALDIADQHKADLVAEAADPTQAGHA